MSLKNSRKSILVRHKATTLIIQKYRKIILENSDLATKNVNVIKIKVATEVALTMSITSATLDEILLGL
jgi:hypothetical protein